MGGVVYAFPNGELNIYMYPYFIVGFCFSRFENNISSLIKKTVMIIFACVFPLMCCFFKQKHYIYTTGLADSKYGVWGSLWIDAYRYLIGFVGSVVVIALLKVIVFIVNKKEIRSVILCCFSKLGKKSLSVYVFSVVFLSFYLPKSFNYIIYGLWGGKNYLFINIWLYYLSTFVVATVYSFGLYFLNFFVEKLNLQKILFGKS